MKEYRNKITYLSFIMAVLVTARHGFNVEVYGLTNGILYWFETWMHQFTALMVPMFFVMSGFLFYQNFSMDKLKDKWKTRFFGLVIPYIIWNVVAYLYFELIYSIPFVASHMNKTMEPLSFYWLIRNALLGGHNITWFLQYLIGYTVIGPFLYPIMKHKKWGTALLAALIILELFADNAFLTNGCIYLFGMWAGCHMAEKVKTVRFNYHQRNAALLYILVTTVACLFISEESFGMINVVLKITQCIAIWIAADYLAIDREPKWWIKISFFIYCTHILILEAIEKLILVALGRNLMGAYIDYILATPLTILFIVFFAAILRKCRPLWNIVTGGR